MPATNYAGIVGGNNLGAFLDTIAWSEIGPQLLAASDNGYNVLVGSTPSHPLLFSSYANHPAILNVQFDSTAAGRYQVLKRYALAYMLSLSLPDFSPTSQDAIAVQQIRESGAYNDVLLGNFAAAMAKCAHIWASLPGAGYNQRENKFRDLQTAYQAAGGTVTA